MKIIIYSLIFILFVSIACNNCQDVSQSGPLSQNGNLLKGLLGNTGNSINRVSAYNPRGNMAAMTGYRPNCPHLQGMTINNAQASSIRFGMNPVQNSLNPVQPFMGLTSGCSCTLTVNMRGCFVCPCGNKETPIPTTGVGTLTIPTTEVLQTGSPRSSSARPIYVSTTSPNDPTTGMSAAIPGKVNEQKQSYINGDQKSNVPVGQNKGLKNTPIPSLMTEKNVTGPLHKILESDKSIKLKNLSDIETTSGNFSSHQTPDVEDLSTERSFPFAISFGCSFVLTCAVCCVLAYLLIQTKKHIKYQRNELYFVEKSFRQSISSNDDSMKSADEIYSLIGKRKPPILPTRTPPLTPTAPPLSTTPPPVSIATSSGQTCFSFSPEDLRHDYLELI